MTFNRAACFPVDPPWRWVGGKTALRSYISARLPRLVRRWHEPFLGGGGIYLGLAPRCPAVLSDGNLHLVDAWLGLQRDPKGAVAHLEQWKAWHEADPVATWTEAKRCAFEYRGMPTAAGQTFAAGWFLYAQQASINGLYRCNAAGRLNAALGKASDGKPHTIKVQPLAVETCSRALQNATILHCPLTERSIPEQPDLEEGDVLVIDPPYLGTYDGYTRERFDEHAHVALETYARRQARRGASVVVSNSLEAERLYPASFWNHEVVMRKGTMSSAADNRKPVGELLLWPRR